MGKNFLFRVMALVLVFLVVVNVNIAHNFTNINFGSKAYAAKTMTVEFPRSSSSSRSQTITIPHLKNIVNMSVNTGSVNYTVNGDNVTISVWGGSSVDYYTPSTYATDFRINSKDEFDNQIYYSSGGYSGNISKDGSSYVVEGQFMPGDIKTETDSRSTTAEDWHRWNGTSWVFEHYEEGYTPASIIYKNNGYEGILRELSQHATSPWLPSFPSNPTNGQLVRRTCTVTHYYSGDIIKPTSDTRKWRQNYSGYAYGSTTYYYAYTVTIQYIDNTAPTINTINSPAQNQIFSEIDNNFVPTITVSDPDGNQLACKFKVDNVEKQSKNITNTATPQVLSFNSFDVSALSEGAHTMTFEVSDGIDAPVQQTLNIKIDKTPPALGAVSFTSDENSITLSGSASDAISGMADPAYHYLVAGFPDVWSNNVSHRIGSLNPNTQYTAKFEAKDKKNHIASKEQSIYTKALVPAISAGNSTDTTFDISFSDANPSYTRYQIKVGSQYVGSTGDLTGTQDWIKLTGKTIRVKGLQPGTAYSIQARAINEENTATAFCTAVTGTTWANAPSDISFSPARNSITLSWNPVTGATSYNVEADGNITNTVQTSFVLGGLNPDTLHTFRISTVNAGGTGKWSGYLTRYTLPNPPDKPLNVSVDDVKQTYVTLSWDAAARAAKYEIRDNGHLVGNVTGTVFTHNNLAAETVHKYTIRAVNAGGESVWTDETAVQTLPYPPETPANINTQPTKTTITLNWDAMPRAVKYYIQIDNGEIKDLGAATTFKHEGLEPYSNHTYKVKAVNPGGDSPWSESIHVMTHPLEPTVPTNVMGTAEKSSVTVLWYKVPFAQSYDVQIDGTTIINVTDLSFVHKELAAGSSHRYRIRARNISGISDWSSEVTVSTLPEVNNPAMSLTNIAAVVTSNSIQIAWDALAKDGQYDIEVDGVMSGIGGNTVYNHTNLKPDTYHTYKVRVRTKDGTSDWCAVLSLSTLPQLPDAPANLQVSAQINSIELKWEKKDGATGYDVEIDGHVIEVGDIDSFMHEGLQPGTEHKYRIRAKNIAGFTAWSPLVIKSTTSPTYIVECKKGQNFDLSLIASNVQDFTGVEFVVKYNADELEVVDLCGLTPRKDTRPSGRVEGTKLTFEHTPGRIVFTVGESIVPGTSWSGEVNNIIFKPKKDGQTNIDLLVE